MKFKLNEDLFEEDTTLKQATQKLDKEVADNAPTPEIDDDELYLNAKTQLEEFLDVILARNLEQRFYSDNDDEEPMNPKRGYQRVEPINVLLIGPAGTGKTAIVKKWCEDNNLNFYTVRAADLERSDLGGIPGRFTDENGHEYARKLTSTEFDKLNRPNSILFLDEINRAPAKVRGSLLSLVQEKSIRDSNDDTGDHYFRNLLFTIAAMNPPVPGYDAELLDQAEASRYIPFFMTADKTAMLRYLIKNLNDDVAFIDRKHPPKEVRDEYMSHVNGRKRLAKTLLTDPTFAFDSPEDSAKGGESLDGTYFPLDYRALLRALRTSDGTKDSFLNVIKYQEKGDFGYNKVKIIENILKGYKDANDKANEALKMKSTNAIFKNAPDGLWAKVKDETGETFN